MAELGFTDTKFNPGNLPRPPDFHFPAMPSMYAQRPTNHPAPTYYSETGVQSRSRNLKRPTPGAGVDHFPTRLRSPNRVEHDRFGLHNPPAPPMRLPYSRTSSSGSIDILTSSSAHNTDDEDSDQKSSTLSYKERRREAHTQAEQKRRDAIKRGYEDLQCLVPTCQQQDSISSYKLSKATVLQRSIDYIQFLLQQRKKQEDELNALRKEVIALQIMKANYEAIVKVHQSHPCENSNKISDEMKFHVFQTICNALFQSFNASISVANFGELSACVFSWLEEYCKPGTLQDMVVHLLCELGCLARMR